MPGAQVAVPAEGGLGPPRRGGHPRRPRTPVLLSGPDLASDVCGSVPAASVLSRHCRLISRVFFY